MEGILLDTVAFGIGGAFVNAVLLAFAVTAVLLGYMEEEERAGARFRWAEWPLYEKAEAPPVERELRIAA